LAGAFPDEVWVTGEISGLKRSAGGHVYFDLVESVDGASTPAASIPVVLFDSNRRGVNALLRRQSSIRMRDGIAIRIRGWVDFYEAQGRVQLRMTGIDAEYTLGRLASEREKLVRELREAGLLEANAARPWPRSPLVIGLATSGASAAAADFLGELRQSRLDWRVLLADVRVQGVRAGASITAAIAALDAHEVDLIVLVRGGGARTDLAVFDEASIAHAIARCARPVVTGIGHDIDESVADLVANRSYKTPTAVAQALVDHVRGVHEAVDARWHRATEAVLDRLDGTRAAMRQLADRVIDATSQTLADDAERVDRQIRRLERDTTLGMQSATNILDRDVARLRVGASNQLRLGDRTLEMRATQMRSLDPERALERGFSLTIVDGRVVSDASSVRAGQLLVTRLARGRVESEIVRTHDPEEPSHAR
jgi:exodeoxyribonuclease VII large subunit